MAGASLDEALIHWQKRDDRVELEKTLEKLEAHLTKNPTDIEATTLFVRGSFLLANSHMQYDLEKKRTLKKAQYLGEKFLFSGKDYEDVLPKLTKREAALLFWITSNLGYYSEVSGILSSLGNKSQILAMLKRTEELYPDYFFGGMLRFWGAYYAVVPGFAGGDLKKSAEYWAKALKAAPEYLGTKVLMAELYLTKKDDRAEFEKVLKEVIASEVKNPEIDPENVMDKRKAQDLLKRADKLF